ncbi:MAG: hypothetical protein ABJC04_00110 [Verrucomicrobiota bacterium]
MVAQTARRRRWLRAWRGLWRGLFAGSALWLIALICYKAFPFPVQILLIAGATGVLAMLIGFLLGWSRSPSLMETARSIDQKQKLQERLSTALEVHETRAPDDWKELVLGDAARHAGSLDPRRLFPAHLPAASKWTLLILAVTAGLGFLPEYRSKAFLQKQKDQAVMQEAGQQLSDLTRRSLTQHPPALEKTRENLETIDELGQQLAKASLTRSDALKNLASAADKLKSEMKELVRNPALKPLERAAREPSRANHGNISPDLQKQMDSLQKSLEGKNTNPEALDQLKNDLQKAQKAAEDLARKNSPENETAKQQLAQSLANLSQQAQEMGMPLANLEEAVAALRANHADTLLKDLNLAMNDLEKTRDMAKALQQMQQQAAEKIGRDLAEQLKNGQAEIAQKTLEQMVSQLKQSNLSAEQIKKLLEEVSQAVDPAGDYGKVKDLLSQAVTQMKQGEKPNAAQSLAEAAKELAKLAQQMNDAESLQAALAALEKAGNCIGGNALGKRYGKGRPGRPGWGTGGVADETGWLYYPSERFTHVDEVAPTLPTRDWTERGEATINDALVPTKTKGQFTPGVPMPGITLKGVSIKGQSKVQYQEAVRAAQSDAQSALNQDQVPRAYQGAVKNYFDDLKE